jgi:2,2-dialkylglycine decarboxylase (pyruvate)
VRGPLIRYRGDPVEGVAERASGSFVETVDGQRMLDFIAGQICATVGHNHGGQRFGAALGYPGA